MIQRNVTLLPALLFAGMLVACAPFLVGPNDPNASLVMGRIVVDNKFAGGLSGLLPLGVLDKSIEVEVETRDGKQYFKVTTDGYFAPNRPVVSLDSGQPFRSIPAAPCRG